MTDSTDEPTTVDNTDDDDNTHDVADTRNEGSISDATLDAADQGDTFPREVVEKLRQENGKYRQRAQRADELGHRLHAELVRATGRLADPADLDYDESHLDDPDALAAAIDELLDRKPHLASRKPMGDIGQGNRGATAEPFSLLGLLKSRT